MLNQRQAAMPSGISPMVKASPVMKAFSASASLTMAIFADSADRPASMAVMSRSSGAVRIMPRNTGIIAGLTVVACQSIQRSATARVCRSSGYRPPGSCFAAR
ncbi:MAG: hypothetical protein EBU57_07310 [Alphaproteobacteria bacterium]|nr:hypothetical protein [Alphaproteobacteria bacterium]